MYIYIVAVFATCTFPYCAQKAEYKKKVCLVSISEECKQLLVSYDVTFC